MVRQLARRAGQILKRRWSLPEPDPEAREAHLSDWYQSPLGQHLLETEGALADRLLGSGYRPFLVQLDSGAHQVLGLDKRLRSQLIVVVSRLENRAAGPSVRAEPEYLPLQPESVDVVLIHHALEYSAAPHRVLREAAQALRPGGHILLFGFNPFGLWGWRRLVTPWRRRFAAWEAPFIRSGRVADWCRLLDCEVEDKLYYYHWPAFHRPGWKRRARWINHLIRVLLPGVGGGYTLLIRKQQMIPLKPARWDPAFILGRQSTGAQLRTARDYTGRGVYRQSGEQTHQHDPKEHSH